jgi:hypothetical protein
MALIPFASFFVVKIDRAAKHQCSVDDSAVAITEVLQRVAT